MKAARLSKEKLKTCLNLAVSKPSDNDDKLFGIDVRFLSKIVMKNSKNRI